MSTATSYTSAGKDQQVQAGTGWKVRAKVESEPKNNSLECHPVATQAAVILAPSASAPVLASKYVEAALRRLLLGEESSRRAQEADLRVRCAVNLRIVCLMGTALVLPLIPS